jgi:DNA-binding NarL/FixJ family response regulator
VPPMPMTADSALPRSGAPRRRLALVGPDQRLGPVRVVIAHGRQLVRAGLRLLLEREAAIAVVGEAAHGEEAVELVRRARPDVIVIDVHLPGLGCVEATRQILAEPSVAVIVLTPSESDGRVFGALQAGAAGVLLEDREPADLVHAVTLLGRGGRPRSGRARRKAPHRENHMLTTKVIEFRRSGGGHPWNSGI